MNICAATGCSERIRSSLLMCRKHWRKVPTAIQHRVWNGYRDGMGPDYVLAVKQAIAAVEARETPSYKREQLQRDAFDEHGEPHDPVVMEPGE